MKKSYLITVDVKSARGTQTFEVRAASAAKAIEIFNAGGTKGPINFVTEEIEVTDIGEPSAELNE